MPQQISKEGLRRLDDVVWFIILESIPRHLSEEDRKKVFADGDKVTVEFRINGVEMDFAKAVNWWNSQYQDRVQKVARELLRQKVDGPFGDLSEFLYDAQKHIEKHLAENFGLELETD